MNKTFATIPVMLVSAAAVIWATGWCMVAPGEVVVVRRLGRLLEPPWGPGLHWRYPLGIDKADRVRSDAVRQLTIGLAASADSGLEPSAGEMMTGDLNLLRVQATVHYRIARPADWILRCGRVETLLEASAGASVSRALAARGVDAILRSDRQAIARDVAMDLQTAADRYQLGVTMLGVSLTDARPPSEVEPDFAAAQSAESRRDSRITEAQSYKETTETAARSLAQARLDRARAAAKRTVLAAGAERQRFLALLAEADQSRALTMRRLYIESLQSLLGQVKRKLILSPGDNIDVTVLGAGPEASAPGVKTIGSDRPQSVAPTEKK
jgi:membrane protease subunit HflK